jgi:protein phosphatase
MKLATGAFSDVGRAREVNEDAFVVDERLALFAIADGMGGHAAGEVASWTAIEALRAAVASGRAVNDAVGAANDAVLEKASDRPELQGMGTTMTAAVVASARQLLIGHVGDSRAYLVHGGALSRLTEDHSLVEELVREGRLTPEQADAHPQRAIVTRALGMEPGVEVDLYTVPVEPGDRLVLCSDGLNTMIRERDIERIARSEADPQRSAELLVDAANEAGGEDNITVVVIDVLEVDEPEAIDPEALAAPVEPPTPEPTSPPDPEPPTSPPPPRRRARAVRTVLVWTLPAVLVVAAAFAALGYYARRSYYVGLDGDRVVVYKGVPGGVLGWDPTVEDRTDLDTADLLPVDLERVESGTARGSKSRAEDYVSLLEVRAAMRTTTTTTSSTTSTTSTTRPRPTTTTRPPPIGP